MPVAVAEADGRGVADGVGRLVALGIGTASVAVAEGTGVSEATGAGVTTIGRDVGAAVDAGVPEGDALDGLAGAGAGASSRFCSGCSLG